MSEQTQDIARVLAEHHDYATDADGTHWLCACGVPIGSYSRERWPDGEFRAHVAEALAPVFAAAVREAEQRALREAVGEIQSPYDLQCPPKRSTFADDDFGRGALCAHQWWSTVLGGTLRRLRDRADRVAVDAPEGGEGR